MSNFEKLTALGAQCVGGDLIWKHKVLGSMRHGELHLTEDGVKALEIEDVVVKEDKPKRASKAKVVDDIELDLSDAV